MLTERQMMLMQFIAGYQRATGSVSPTFEVCRAGCGGIAKSNVHRIMRALEERGYIRRERHREQHIEILKPVHFALAWGDGGAFVQTVRGWARIEMNPGKKG